MEKPARTEPRVYPVYSDAVCRALSRIRAVRAEEESKLAADDRPELCDALQLLALAGLLELQISSLGHGHGD